MFTLGEFTRHLLVAATAEIAALQEGLEVAAKLIESSAKKEIGHLQPEVGPFNAWDELAESTQIEKERLGYVFNDDYNPLLRTGELRDSIQHEVRPLEAIVGSRSMIMAYQEFGTSRGIPPRPVLGPAAYKNKEKIRAIIGAAAISGIVGSRRIPEALGYDMEAEA